MSRVRPPFPAPNVATRAPLGFRPAGSSAPALRSRGARLLPFGRLRAPRTGVGTAENLAGDRIRSQKFHGAFSGESSWVLRDPCASGRGGDGRGLSGEGPEARP